MPRQSALSKGFRMRDIVLEVRDVNCDIVARVTNGLEIEAIRTLHAPDLLRVTIDDHQLAAGHLQQPKGHLRLLVDGKVFATGSIETVSQKLRPGSPVTVEAVGHWQRLHQIVCLPNPAETIGGTTERFILSGKAGDAIPRAINIQTSGSPGREGRKGERVTADIEDVGPNVRISGRFQTVADVIGVHLDASTRVFRMEMHVDGELMVRQRPEITIKPAISWDSPIIEDGELKQTASTASRAIIGGPGEGTARKMLSLIGVDNPTREVFVDARDIKDDANVIPTMGHRGNAALLAARAKTELVNATLAEHGRWRWPETHDCGDWVTIITRQGQEVKTRITTMRLVADKSQGIVITAMLGAWSGSPFEAMARRQHDLARRLRTLEVR